MHECAKAILCAAVVSCEAHQCRIQGASSRPYDLSVSTMLVVSNLCCVLAIAFMSALTTRRPSATVIEDVDQCLDDDPSLSNTVIALFPMSVSSFIGSIWGVVAFSAAGSTFLVVPPGSTAGVIGRIVVMTSFILQSEVAGHVSRWEHHPE